MSLNTNLIFFSLPGPMLTKPSSVHQDSTYDVRCSNKKSKTPQVENLVMGELHTHHISHIYMYYRSERAA